MPRKIVYGFVSMRLYTEPTTTLSIVEWARSQAIKHDIRYAVVDVSTSCGAGTAWALASKGVDVELVAPLDKELSGPMYGDAADLASQVHRMDLHDENDKAAFLSMCDHLVVLPDADMTMIQMKYPATFGPVTVKVREYDSFDPGLLPGHRTTRRQDTGHKNASRR